MLFLNGSDSLSEKENERKIFFLLFLQQVLLLLHLTIHYDGHQFSSFLS
jgi:hypothetical protein